MIKLIQARPESRDCTAPYDVVLSKPYTITEFIKEVLATRSGDWGEFVVRRKGSDWLDHMAVVKYRYGKLENRDGKKAEIPENLAILSITEVKASGGWSAMDYNIIIE